MKSVKWVEDQILSIKIDEGIYSLAQMRKNSLMEFFDVRRDSDTWKNIDLNKENIIFCLFVTEKKIKPIFSSIVDASKVSPNKRPIKKKMLSAIFGQGPKGGAKLIELTDNYSSYQAKIIKDNLSITTDISEIYDNELCGMVGDPEKIRKRLIIYFNTGVNWDESKGFIFSGVPLPPPTR
ncbi:hypothetical protein VV867_17295 [Pseudomonas sp. JH-2]|uniref:hypothetical protein n=1 Tax=Pseudomonas sp. JH-2 TaxID=3114998 RepID=UPI002E2706A4|nr:hypothetical protein [Pseudomonas sp. JH-2]